MRGPLPFFRSQVMYIEIHKNIYMYVYMAFVAGIVAQMRKNENRITVDDVNMILADSYGFCWGVERAVQMAYEAKKRYCHSWM